MGITSKAIAPFIAAAISVEGAYEEVEKETVEGLAEELGLKDLDKEVEAAFKKIEKLEEDKGLRKRSRLTCYLRCACF